MNKILYDKFKDNSFKRKIRVIVHYTGSPNVNGSLEWLNKRKGGKGSIGYNIIIDQSHEVFYLAKPTEWFHNTGLGSRYDKDTFSIAFTGNGIDDITDAMIKDFRDELENLKTIFNVYEIRCHHECNIKKPDFSPEEWEILKRRIGI